MKKGFRRECPICKKIINSGKISLTSFEDIFKRHLRTHKLYSQSISQASVEGK